MNRQDRSPANTNAQSAAFNRRKNENAIAPSIRPARVEDGERLRSIMARSKSYWGYDDALVREWADGSDFSENRFHGQEIYVADVDGQLVAWAGLIPPVDGVATLDDLWVEPAWIGHGLGAILFRLAQRRAEELGARVMEWEAEPNALGFYRKMGGHYLRDYISEWGRRGTIMGLDIGTDVVSDNDESPQSGAE